MGATEPRGAVEAGKQERKGITIGMGRSIRKGNSRYKGISRGMEEARKVAQARGELSARGAVKVILAKEARRAVQTEGAI